MPAANDSVLTSASSSTDDGVAPGDWPEVFALLDTALDLDAPARERWLDTLTPEQAHLAPTLQRLLAVHAEVKTGDFLQETPDFVFAGQRDRFALAAGTQVGPYRLLREIGQGGMASVWLAERADGLLARRIALKLPHASWGASAFEDRMARERNILASLTHPNIARLYDAGIAGDGRPFLALEYVDGQPIDLFASAQQLGTRARIDLILQVAHAVAHAHARLVVHRDLKPSNILVDAAGQAHLLDFGIAKLTDPALDDGGPDRAATQAFGRALTPDYASPEQARGDTIGTASDVYSLGVVAYELLAGVRPYHFEKGTGALALAQALERMDAPRASSVAADPVVARQLAGDLDAILARALAAAPYERYPTIDAFAADLERHLRGEPVQARPDSRWYRTERWVRRHKLESAIVGALLVAALGGAYAQVLVLLAFAIGAAAALWQRNRALKEAQRARTALERAEQVTGFVASIFTQAVPRAGQGGAVTAADLLRAASIRVESDLDGQPEVAAELGALIGASFNELGELKDSLVWLPKVVERCTRALGPLHRLTLQSRWRLVEAANSIGELAVSEPLLAPLVRDLRAISPPLPALLVAALRSQAFVHTKRGREADAMAALHEAVAVGAAQLGELHEDTLTARGSLSNTFAHFGRSREALAAIEPALEPALMAFGAERPHPTLTMIERTHGDALARNDRPGDALPMLQRVLDDQRSLDAGDSNRVRVAMTLLAGANVYAGRFDEAERLYTEAQSLHLRLTGGVNHEAVQLTSSRALLRAYYADGPGALAHMARVDEIVAQGLDVSGYEIYLGSVRIFALAVAGQVEQVMALAQSLQPLLTGSSVGTQLRTLRCRALVLRQAGSVAQAHDFALQGLAVMESGRCTGLERGIGWTEAGHCKVALGDPVAARHCYEKALSTWAGAQIDGPMLLQPVQHALEALAR